MSQFVGEEDDALVFTSPVGAPMRHSNFYRRAWLPAVRQVGLTGVHFHDLRHTGNTLTADAGANLRELMERMGHSSTRAGLRWSTSIRPATGSALSPTAPRPRQRSPRPRHPRATPRHLARRWHAIAARRRDIPQQRAKTNSELHKLWYARQDSNPRPAA
jgi:hypothetical protein